MTEDLEPDFTVDQLDELSTVEQREKLFEMKKFGWRASHLWEKEKGVIAVWCITNGLGREADTYLHSYILPDGEMKRYEPKKG